MSRILGPVALARRRGWKIERGVLWGLIYRDRWFAYRGWSAPPWRSYRTAKEAALAVLTHEERPMPIHAPPRPAASRDPAVEV